MTSTDMQTREKPKSIIDRIEDLAPQLSRLHIDVDRFVRVMRTEVRNTPELLECEPTSLLGAVMAAAQLGLEPGKEDNKPQCYFIPRYDKNIRRKRCHFMLSYHGMKDLAEWAGWRVSASVIREGDHFDHQLQPEPHIEHRPAIPHDGDVVGAYAVGRPLHDDGPDQIVVLDRDEIERRRRAGDNPDGFGWTDWFELMCEKSAIRALWKKIPADSEQMEAAARHDESVIDLRHLDDGDVKMIDQRPAGAKRGEDDGTEAADGDGDVSPGQRHPDGPDGAAETAGDCTHGGPTDRIDADGGVRCRSCGETLDRRPVATRARELGVFPPDLCHEATAVARDDLDLDVTYMAAAELDDAPDAVHDGLHRWLDQVAADQQEEAADG